MRVIDVEQGTQEWLDARVGVLTASKMDKIITPKTGKPSASLKKLALEMIAEELLGRSLDDASSGFMQRGGSLEAEARGWYEFERDVTVTRVGICVRDDGLVGFSPDGLVGEDGGLEIKCPSAAVHMGYLLEGGFDEYYCQIQGSLWISGRKWWDFVSYCPFMPPVLYRFYPDLEFIAKLEIAVGQLLDLLAEYRIKLSGIIPPMTKDFDG